MGYETILVSKGEGVAVLTLNRPEVLNAMNSRLVTELEMAISEAEEDSEVRAIIITGAGDRAFSAGADIHEQRSDANELTPEEGQARRAARDQFFWRVATFPKPTIGAINGLAYGGGAVLASCLDIRVGTDNSSFRFLAASYGRINSTWTLPLQIGWPMAKDLLFTGRVVGAQEAHRIGLLNHLVPAGDLMDRATEMGTTVAANNPDSVGGVKHMLLENIGLKWQEMWERERIYLSEGMKVPGVEEAFKEFLDRKGR